MCVVSYVGDYWKDNLPGTHPWVQPMIYPTSSPVPNSARIVSHPTREEFDALRKEVEELKKLLLAAKAYDEKTGQPDCELESKIELIKKVADLVGVSMEDVFGKSNVK